MKKINSIYRIFIIFLCMIIASFMLLYWYSNVNLQESLVEVAQIQMAHSSELLDQKIREIEIEADGILYSNSLKELQLVMTDAYDSYNYVTHVNEMKEYLRSRQASTVGMAEFILYWPGKGRILSTSVASRVDKELLKLVKDNQWIDYGNEIYFVRSYRTDWDQEDDEPYLLIRMDRDYLYEIKNMAYGMGEGGTILVLPNRSSLFSISDQETALLQKTVGQQGRDSAYVLESDYGKYQILESEAAKNGLSIISYYPIRAMLRPVAYISKITVVSLCVLLAVGFLFLVLYYKNILLQLRMITEKLSQVEDGDLTARITEMPDNEFTYVFEQFNRMVVRIQQLIDSTVKEQQLRSQAELRQLQLQINPHFLYNSLSYIVTVAKKPEAVTQMAVHLANYYRYCTKKKSIATIREEISYAKAYLSIMAMRRDIEYSIEVEEGLYEMQVIPLILQPIIENAVKHAIEEREDATHIFVKIYRGEENLVHFEVSDDGDGMSEGEIERLMERLYRKERKEDESVGLWNVNQRLINYYDESSGLKFGSSMWGGLMVQFAISEDQPGCRGGTHENTEIMDSFYGEKRDDSINRR